MQETRKVLEGRMNYEAVCLGKEPFDTYSRADRVQKAMVRRKQGKLHVYKCPHCQKYHIGLGGRKEVKRGFKH